MDEKTILKNLEIEALNSMQKSMQSAAAASAGIILLSPTGSGKTLAFMLPLLSKLKSNIKEVQAVILVPSRELALQHEQVFKKTGTSHKVTVCYGGHDKAIEKNSFIEPPAVLIGTPGRVAYHLRQKNFSTYSIHTVVLDEFDKALELGFQDDMSRIIGDFGNLQNRYLTSATALEKVPEFVGMDKCTILNFLDKKDVEPDLTFRKIETSPEEKLETLFNLLCFIGEGPSLIFCNHREAVERISNLLYEKGIQRETFHGGMEQEARERALLKFRNGSSRFLITTDLAARGLDIPAVQAIVHYQLPQTEQAFVHRNGRTARMLAQGLAYFIVTPEDEIFFAPPAAENFILPENLQLPPPAKMETLYLSAGKKDKVGKGDIAGFLIKKGGLTMADIGTIEVKDKVAYAAIDRSKIRQTVKLLAGHRLKNLKLKIEIAR